MSSVSLRAAGTGMLLLLVVFALATERTLAKGAGEMELSDRAFHAGQLERAVRHARRAASAYVPGAAHVEAAHARLRAVALGAERERNVPLAREAWRAMRASALDSRHFWQPHTAELEEAESSSRRLAGVAAVASPTARPRVVRPQAALALGVCFAFSVAGFALVIWRGRRATGRWALRQVRAPIVLYVVGLVGFALTLFGV